MKLLTSVLAFIIISANINAINEVHAKTAGS